MTSEKTDAADVMEWSTGPENSWIVRGLLYVMLGAVVAEFVIVIGIFLLAAAFLHVAFGPVRGVGISLAAVLLVGALALRTAVEIYAVWWDDWRAQAFRRRFRLRWAVLATVLVTGLIVELAFAWNELAPLWVTPVLGLVTLFAAYGLSDRGTFNPDSGLLVYEDDWELELKTIEIGRRLTIGPHSFVKVTDVPEDSTTDAGLYGLPTEVVDELEFGRRN